MAILAKRLRHATTAAWLIAFPASVCFSQVIHHPVSHHRPEPRRPISGRWPTFYISGCQEITIPGLYMLTADIDTGGAACINIHDIDPVSLDCNGHRITASNGIVPVMVQNATAVTITNCSLSNQYMSPQGTVTPYGLDIKNSADITLNYNTIAGIHFYGVSTAHVSNNQIVGYYAQYNSHNGTVSENIITGGADESGAAGIIFDGGYSNQALNNTMDGKWDGVSSHFNGWDDGIILTNETGDLISGNTIQHVWDAGIEATYSLTNTVISNNTIQHTLTAAIGAWWYPEWIGNQILNNQADDVSQLLSIYYDENVGIPPPPKVHFENNRFVGNVILHPSAFDTFALNSQSKITITPAGYPQVLADNNILQDNHFGQFAPELIPAAGFIDGGGNVCQTATAVIACNR